MNPSATLSKWIIRPQPYPQARLRLFCFPYAGGGAAVFRSWSTTLSPDVEVCPIELPGRGSRFSDPPLTHMPQLLQSLTQAILPYLDKPFAFFGHSMGALISFELAHALYDQHGQLPSYLIVSGRPAPQLPPAKSIHLLPDAHFLEEVRQFNGIPDHVLSNSELMSLFLPILRADFTLIETHAYSAAHSSLGCDIVAIGGLQDVNVNIEDLEAWREQTMQGFSIHLLQGDHFFIHSAQAQVLRLLKTKLSTRG